MVRVVIYLGDGEEKEYLFEHVDPAFDFYWAAQKAGHKVDLTAVKDAP